MDKNDEKNLDLTVLTREYSSELERAIVVRNYLKAKRDEEDRKERDKKERDKKERDRKERECG